MNPVRVGLEKVTPRSFFARCLGDLDGMTFGTVSELPPQLLGKEVRVGNGERIGCVEIAEPTPVIDCLTLVGGYSVTGMPLWSAAAMQTPCARPSLSMV